MSPRPLDKSILLALGLVGATACACLDVDVCLAAEDSDEADSDTDVDSDTDTDTCLSELRADGDAIPAGTPAAPTGERDALIERLADEGTLPDDVADRAGGRG